MGNITSSRADYERKVIDKGDVLVKDDTKLNDIQNPEQNDNTALPKAETPHTGADNQKNREIKNDPRFTVASEKGFYRTPPNTVPNGFFPPNTLRKPSDMPQPSNSLQGAPRINTLRNKNAPSYPANPNTTSSYERTNTYLNKKAGAVPNYNRGYNQNPPYQPQHFTTPNYGRVNTLRNPNYQYYAAYPQYNQYQPSMDMNRQGYQGYPVYPPYGGYPGYVPNYNNQMGYYQGGYRPQYRPPQAQQPMRMGMYDAYNPKYLESLSLSQACSKAGGVTIAIFTVMIIFAIVIEFTAMYFGVLQNIPDIKKDPYVGFTPMGFYLFEGLNSLVAIFLPALFYIKKSGKRLDQTVPFNKNGSKKTFAMVGAGIGFCMIAQLMSSVLGAIANLFGVDISKGAEMQIATGVMDLFMGVICIAVIPALVEEFAYRGFVLSILKDHDELLAVIGSAFLFGILHGNFAQIPFAFVVGLVLGYVRVKSDSMLPSILIHFANNCYAVLMMYLAGLMSSRILEMINLVIVLLFIIAGIWGVSYLAKNDKSFFELKTKKTLISYDEKIKTFFSTGTVIACMIVLFLLSILIVAFV